jgi:hypothetical protein
MSLSKRFRRLSSQGTERLDAMLPSLEDAHMHSSTSQSKPVALDDFLVPPAEILAAAHSHTNFTDIGQENTRIPDVPVLTSPGSGSSLPVPGVASQPQQTSAVAAGPLRLQSAIRLLVPTSYSAAAAARNADANSWTAPQTLLRTLDQCADVYSPLKAIVTEFVQNIEIYEV